MKSTRPPMAVQTICMNCSRTFMIGRNVLRRGSGKYCSRECVNPARAFGDDFTQADLKRVISYDPTTGHFTWLTGARKGRRAGYYNPTNYVQVGIGKRIIGGHLLVWFYTYGEWPADEIDHINRDRHDNRLSNLRAATRSQNCANKVPANAARYRGVSKPSARSSRFRAVITVNLRAKYLGYFNTEIEAARAYDTAAKQFFGPFARLNFPNDQSAVPPEVFFKPQESSECRTNGSVPETLESAA